MLFCVLFLVFILRNVKEKVEKGLYYSNVEDFD